MRFSKYFKRNVILDHIPRGIEISTTFSEYIKINNLNKCIIIYILIYSSTVDLLSEIYKKILRMLKRFIITNMYSIFSNNFMYFFIIIYLLYFSKNSLCQEKVSECTTFSFLSLGIFYFLSFTGL